MGQNVFLLVLTAAIKILLTAWTFGMMVRYLIPNVATCFMSHNTDTCWYFLANYRHRSMLRPCSWPTHVCYDLCIVVNTY